jgi:quercetin dioxygenase-like cupin family protein
MRLIARGLLVLAIFVGGVAMGARHRGGGTAAAQEWPVIGVTRVYSGADGQSHAEEVEAKLGVANQLGLQQSEAVKAASTNFVRFPSNFLEDWHCAHARRYVITLSGRGEVEVAGGRRIRMEPGRVVLFEDRTGKGHISRALTADWTAVFVQLE